MSCLYFDLMNVQLVENVNILNKMNLYECIESSLVKDLLCLLGYDIDCLLFISPHRLSSLAAVFLLAFFGDPVFRFF